MIAQSYCYENLLETSENWNISYNDNVIQIDNFYKNADDIYNHLNNRNYPLWKYDKQTNTRNGIDYNDCRIVDKIQYPTKSYLTAHNKIVNICQKYWWPGEYNWLPHFEVNCFQTKKVFDNKLQHFPHIDSNLNVANNNSVLNVLIYLDKQEDGGTAIYEGNYIENNEAQNLLYPCTKTLKIKKLIKHKFNRCVIFPGNCMHGAYIENYKKYVKNWRFTQIIFLHPILN